MPEFVTIKIEREVYNSVASTFAHEVIKVDIKDDFFKDDQNHSKLKKIADKAYKELKEYEWNKRYPS